MKKLLYTTIATLLCLSATLWYGCKEKEWPGSINGSITDKATGEPIKTAGVELLPGGQKTVTGSDGEYSFPEVDPGTYKLHITKTGYEELVSNEIVVNSSKPTPFVVQLEKLPPSLRIVNDKTEDIDSLDFGANQDDKSRSFNIFNDGIESLEWEITKTAEWIIGISKENGEIKAGKTQTIILTIDREKLKGGENVTTVHITSNDGSKQLRVIATGENMSLPTLNTLAATDVKMTSAILHGVLTDVGVPSYTERGFVYGLSSMPTIDNTVSKLTVAVTEDNSFQATVTNLEEGNTYYVRAYAINKAGTAYSTNEVRLTVQKTLPVVKTETITNKSIAMGRATLSGTIEDVGEPVYTERGFVYGTNHNPMLEDATKKSVTGTGTGTFMANLTDLEMGEVYYVRAYATNEVGTAYGEELELDFHAVLPEVNTMPITNISIANGVARFNASVNGIGDPAYAERGFVYGEQHEPTIEQDTKRVVSGQGIGEFYVDVTDFEIGKSYYVRAYAKTESNTVYGKEEILDFSPILPEVKTLDVLNIDASSVTLKAKIESLGDPVYTEAGFVYGTVPNPLLDGAAVVKEIVEGTGVGNYEKKIEGLNRGASYYVRAYLRNEHYVVYGDIVPFKAESAKSMVIPGYETLMVQKEDLGVGDWKSADAMCKGSTVDGYTDWRLPTKEELMILYNKREMIGSFSTSYYWSASLYSTYSGYYYINFSTGRSDYGYSTMCRIRAVRTITE